MNFTDISGREHRIDIRPSKWHKKDFGKGRGKFQSFVGDILGEAFPGDIVLEEFPCLGERLYLDFFLPRRKIAIEVQGEQHYRFNAFFHNSRADFLAQKKRDCRKQEWCDINEIKLIKIRYGECEEKIKAALS